MNFLEDTICAVATAPGQSGISVVRISGKESKRIVEDLIKNFDGDNIDLKPRKAHFANLFHNESLLDQVVVTYFKAPASYTGEDVVEISTHGSIYIQQSLIELLINNGARLAKAGEFTKRAFLNSKIDLSQSEAIADLIASESKVGHQLAIKQLKGNISTEINTLREHLVNFASLIELELDFGEEDVEFADRKELLELLNKILTRIKLLTNSFKYGNAVKEGIPVAIAGPPNTGKSSLLNYLLNEDKAIVSEIPGTTRDTIEDKINISGYTFRFIDTAGIRDTPDVVESLGIERTHQRISKAAIILLVLDINDDVLENEKILEKIKASIMEDEQQLILLLNKSDIYKRDVPNLLGKQIAISVKTGEGLDILNQELINVIKEMPGYNQELVLTNMRHYQAFKKAVEALERARIGISSNISSDFVAQDIREALHYLGEVTGAISTDEILGAIFSRFCIGK
ncbi:MAG: tRNA uridine-5-carboxymethylaminomethyl(34) synthesis GTPase MnmE [Bacteroidales bacterium]|jgi:tRNA modification GTPase|nr:tRNA uridine-5-carboxymethylaminomethyl(34) synthesis GTPase MnmE [Bacteroidales bacterium]